MMKIGKIIFLIFWILVAIFCFYIGFCQSQEFALPFRYGASSQLILFDNMTYIDYLATNALYHYVTNTNANIFYAWDDSLYGRNIVDGNIIYRANHPSTQLVTSLDKDGRVWTINNTDSSAIRVWTADLSSHETYILDSGHPVQEIQAMALTYNNQYVYVTEYQTTSQLVKYHVDSLNGGNYEWQVTVSGGYCYFLCVDDSNNCYVSKNPSSGGQFYKFYASDGSQAWSANGSAYIAFDPKGKQIFAPSKGCSNPQRIKMINRSTGALIGESADLGMVTWCVAVRDTFLYAGLIYESGTGTHGIYKFSIKNDWTTPQSALSSLTILDDTDYVFVIDPCGTIYEEMYKLRIPHQVHRRRWAW